MTLTYKLDQNDYVQYQLFVGSKSKSNKQQRLRSWLVFSGGMFFLSFMFYQSQNKPMYYYFLVLGVIALLLYPLYQRNYYKTYYRKFIADNFKYRFGLTSVVTFTGSSLETSDSTGETKLFLKGLETATETADYFFVKFKTAEFLILPKSKIDQLPELREELKRICIAFNIPFIEELNWRW